MPTMSAEGCRRGWTDRKLQHKQIYQLQNLKTQENGFRSQGTGAQSLGPGEEVASARGPAVSSCLALEPCGQGRVLPRLVIRFSAELGARGGGLASAAPSPPPCSHNS